MIKKIIRVALVIIFILIGFSSEKTHAATDATLSFDQVSVSEVVGQTVTLIAQINPGTNNVGGVELDITFDPVVLRLDSISRSSAFNITPSGPTINNTSGTGAIDVGLITNPATYITAPADVATFVFTTLSTASNSPVSFATTSNASALGEYVVATRTGAQVTVTSSGADVTPPVVTNFVIPATSDSLVVPITTFTATDVVGVAGYKLTETDVAPTAESSGWTVSRPDNYTFSSAGEKTLYAWAKDSDGNVSTSLNDSVIITIADTTAPVVTAFDIPSVIYETFVIPITTLTATDATGVEGYMITESSTAPAAGAEGWTVGVPANYTCSSAGEKTLYAWAKDAAGNVSANLNDNAIIIIADVIAPTVTAFDIPVTSSSLTVSITTLTATDAVDVAGYILTESDTTPLEDASEWTIDAPNSYTFSSAGEKTLYAWAKDADGNVSDSLSDNVTITISDVTFPTISNGIPVGKLSSSTESVSLSVITNEAATCKFSTSAGNTYESMSDTFSTTGETTHVTSISGLRDDRNYVYYVRCQNGEGNANTIDYTVSFSIKEKDSADDEKKPKRKISDSKTKVSKGETLIQRGSGFSKKADLLLYFTKANGSYYAPLKVKTSSSGKFVVYYRVNKPAGKYNWYVVDTKTGKKSKMHTYTIK